MEPGDEKKNKRDIMAKAIFTGKQIEEFSFSKGPFPPDTVVHNISWALQISFHE